MVKPRSLWGVIAVALASGLMAFAYRRSLGGGDRAWVVAHLPRIAAWMALSVGSWTVALGVAAVMPSVTMRARLVAVGAMGILLAALFHSDQGDSFAQHGSYNTLVFLLLAIPMSAFVLIAIFAYRTARHRRWLTAAWLASMVGVLLALGLPLGRARATWGEGLLARQLLTAQDPNERAALDALGANAQYPCDLQTQANWPVVDALPRGIQSFWTGSQTCPATLVEDATWDEDGTFTMRCANGLAPSYLVVPDTRTFSTRDKKGRRFNRTVVAKMSRRPYDGPVAIRGGAEAIVAQCGLDESTRKRDRSNKRVVLRVEAPRVEKSDGAGARPGPNVLIVYLDAVSRRHFARALPKTAARLSNWSAAEGPSRLYQFFRYHIVDFATDGNSIALYSGGKQGEPIWSDFKRSGYVTARVDDSCEDWSTAYLGHATSGDLDHELVGPFCHPDYFPSDGHPYGNFDGPYSIRRRCLGDAYVHRHVLEYARALRRAYRQTPWFTVLSFIEGHEGTGEVISTMDDDLAGLIDELGNEGELSRTVVLFVADHGLHMGLNFMYTENGRLEHRTPLLMLALPRSLELAPSVEAALRHNEQALVTAFDVHDTLSQLVRPGALTDEAPLTDSLFAPIPYSRTCEQAKIPSSLCMCVQPSP